MRVLIENYRGWEILFDTNDEKFYTLSNQEDIQEEKKSFTSAKKYVDDYIKNNLNFKPIKVERLLTLFNSRDTITLIGIRKDGAFMIEDSKGNKQQLSKYDEKSYFLVDSQNEPYFNRIEELRTEMNKITEEIKEIEGKVVKVTVQQIRKNLLG